MQITPKHWNIKKGIKSNGKVMLSTLLDFTYFSSYLQTKENELTQSFWNQTFQITTFQNFIATFSARQKYEAAQFLTILPNSQCSIFWTTSVTNYFPKLIWRY